MNSRETIKTTVRLPADLHWQFQSERAKRRLSNEKAISEALALWIAHHPQSRTSPPVRISAARRFKPPLPRADEEESVAMLLRILRDNRNPSRASTLRAFLRELSAQNRGEHAAPPVSGPSATAVEGRDENLQQPRPVAKAGRRRTLSAPSSGQGEEKET